MTERTRINLDNLHFVVSIGTFISIAVAIFWFGRWVARLEAHCKYDWTTRDQAQWVHDTERENPAWKSASVFAIKAANTEGLQ